MAKKKKDKRNLQDTTLPILVIIIITFIVYGQTVHFEFLNYDDDIYVTDNPHVYNGITISSLVWAVTTFRACNWQPLTWLSHMLDIQLFGMNSGLHHYTSVTIHVINCILLFTIIHSLSGKLWVSTFISGIFALHPLNIESVAWIAERKNVLSTLFFFCMVLMYIRFTKHPGLIRYFFVLLFFCFGLMSKPMLISVPFILLLLDYWPLQRFQRLQTSWIDPSLELPPQKDMSVLFIEKLPFFVFSIMNGIVTIIAQYRCGSIRTVMEIPLSSRFLQAIISYCDYIVDLIWPVRLNVLYIHPETVQIRQFLISFVIFSLISYFVYKWRKKFPFIIVGWLWYIITLLPVIGILQVGVQARANRYAYITFIGLYIIISFGITVLTSKNRQCEGFAKWLYIIILIVLSTITWRNLRFWHDSITLFNRALVLDPNNYIAQNNLGTAWAHENEYEKALRYYRRAIDLKPQSAEYHFNLGLCFLKLGKNTPAITYFKKALERNPDYIEVYPNLGLCYFSKGEFTQAHHYFQKIVDILPEDAAAHNNLGVVLVKLGNIKKGIEHFEKALVIDPTYEQARQNLEKHRIVPNF